MLRCAPLAGELAVDVSLLASVLQALAICIRGSRFSIRDALLGLRVKVSLGLRADASLALRADARGCAMA